MNEHQIQKAAFQYIRLKQAQDWRWRLVYAIPNGGHRNKVSAAKMKAEGATSGVWDISVDYPVAPYSGLKIEVKTERGALTTSQKEMQSLYQQAGYLCKVCRTPEEIWSTIKRYFSLDKKKI